MLVPAPAAVRAETRTCRAMTASIYCARQVVHLGACLGLVACQIKRTS